MEKDDINMTEQQVKAEKFRILKNIIIISIGFLFNFTAFQGLSRLQSSLFIDDGMGTINMGILYGALVLSCLFLPKIVIRYLGYKWTIPVSFCGYILWMAANGTASWDVMTPASIVVGLCAAPLWTAQCSYLTIEAERYAKLSKETQTAVITRFFGIFFCFFQMSSITGSIITSTVLQPTEKNGTRTEPGEYELQFCGGKDCPGVNVTNPNLEKAESHVVWTMLGIFIGVAVLGAVGVGALVDRIPEHRRRLQRKGSLKTEIQELLLTTVKHLRHRDQLLLIPLTLYSGFEQAFYNAEFSKSFISCSIGYWNVGLVTIPYGIVNACVSFFSGRIAKYTGRLPIFAAGFIVDLSLHITLMTWMPHPDQAYVLYILAGMWGFSDGIWQTQINALYGSLFIKESEAAFSNYRMWESLGFIIAFVYSSFLCTSVKLYVLISVLILGWSGYVTVEYLTKKAAIQCLEIDHSLDGKKTTAIDNSNGVNPAFQPEEKI